MKGKAAISHLDKKGFSLVMVVFFMMLLSILGWSLLNFLSGDLEMGDRSLDSERAFYLAESGIHDALMHLTLNDEQFNNDSDHLIRRLAYGEYNVTRETNGLEVNVTSKGYIPGQSNYRAMRQVKIVTMPSSVLGRSAFTGGEWFDWNDINASSVVNADIAAANFEGRDIGTTWNQNASQTTPSDFAVPGTGERIQSTSPLPGIDMDWFYKNKDTYSPSDIVINSNKNNKGIWFVEGNVTIDTTSASKGLIIQHTYIIARKNIRIIGGNAVTFKSRIYPTDRAYPVLATQYGNITFEAPSDLKASSHFFDGLIFTQFGRAVIDCIDGVAVIGASVKLLNNIRLVYDAKYVDTGHGFVAAEKATTRYWQEQ